MNKKELQMKKKGRSLTGLRCLNMLSVLSFSILELQEKEKSN